LLNWPNNPAVWRREFEEQFELLRAGCSGTSQADRLHADYRYTGHSASPDPQVLAHFRKRLDASLDFLEQHLRRCAFAIGDRPTVATFQ